MGDYHQAFWTDFITKATKKTKVKLPESVFIKLVKRWAFFDKSYKLSQVKKDLKVVGRLDLTDTKGVIHELKTSRRSPNAQDIRSDPQLSLYQIGYRTLKGKGPSGISKDYIVLSKNNSRIVRFIVHRPFIDKKTILRNVISIMNAAYSNIFYCMHPAESWLCSKDWCGYYTLHQELKKVGLERFMAKYKKK